MAGWNGREAPGSRLISLLLCFLLAENENEKPITAKVTMCEWSAGVRAPFQLQYLLVAPFKKNIYKKKIFVFFYYPLRDKSSIPIILLVAQAAGATTVCQHAAPPLCPKCVSYMCKRELLLLLSSFIPLYCHYTRLTGRILTARGK